MKRLFRQQIEILEHEPMGFIVYSLLAQALLIRVETYLIRDRRNLLEIADSSLNLEPEIEKVRIS